MPEYFPVKLGIPKIPDIAIDDQGFDSEMDSSDQPSDIESDKESIPEDPVDFI